MAIEIGSLVVRGTFGTAPRNTNDEPRLSDAIDRLRTEMRAEMQDLLREAERRRKED
jgi:hypothetical protein